MRFFTVLRFVLVCSTLGLVPLGNSKSLPRFPTQTCAGQAIGERDVRLGNEGTVTLVDYSGLIITWQSSINGGAWQDLGLSSDVLTYQNLVTTTRYRARVSSCSGGADEYSNECAIRVEEATLNWTESQSVHADGTTITSHSRTYFGADGKALQTQAQALSKGKVLATQPLYGRYGEAVGSTLSAPVEKTDFTYDPLFVTSAAATTSPYDYTAFDTEATQGNPTAVDATRPNSLGWYYSKKNTLEPYTPSTSYPYTRTITSPDGSTGVVRTTIPGEVFRAGQGRETVSGQFGVVTELDQYLALRNKYFTADVASSGASSITDDCISTEALLAWLPFNDPAGSTTAHDASGNFRSGQLNGGTWQPSSMANGSDYLRLTGSENVTLPLAGTPSYFSVSFWVNPATLNNDVNVFLGATRGDSDPNNPTGAFFFYANRDGQIITGTGYGNNGAVMTTAAGVMTTNEWQHYTFTFDNGTGNLYRNGSPVLTLLGMPLPYVWNGFAIGRGGAIPFESSIKNLRIYFRAITQQEQYALYQCQKSSLVVNSGAGLAQGLKVWLPFDDQTGTVAHDASTHGYDGQLSNGGTWTATSAVSAGALTLNSPQDVIIPLSGTPDAFTVSFWMNPAQLNDDGMYLGAQPGFDLWGSFGFRSDKDGVIHAGTRYDAHSILTTAGTLEKEKWQYFTFTYANNTGTLYKNGELVQAVSGMSAPLPWHYFMIGGTSVSQYGTYNGGIDELRIYFRTITQEEIKKLYQSTNVPDLGNGVLSLRDAAVQQLSVSADKQRTISIQDKEGHAVMSMRQALGAADAWAVAHNTVAIGLPYYYATPNANKVIYSNLQIKNCEYIVSYDRSGTLLYAGDPATFSPPSDGSYFNIFSSTSFTVSFDGIKMDYANGSAGSIVATKIDGVKQFHNFYTLTAGAVTITPATSQSDYQLLDTAADPDAADVTASFKADPTQLPAGVYQLVIKTGQVTLTYDNYYKDISYSFYNQKGQVVGSIAPNGVQKILADVATGGTQYPTIGTLPFFSSYEYDVQGHVTAMTETDAGRTEYIYRTDGKLRFTQNAKQRVTNRLSYMGYDAIGRTTEAGECVTDAGYFATLKTTNASVAESTEFGGSGLPSTFTRLDVVHTYYDLAAPLSETGAPPFAAHGVSNYESSFTAGRAVSTARFATGSPATGYTPATRTWYGFDEQGRTQWQITQAYGLNYLSAPATAAASNPALAGYWQFNEGSGATVADISGHGATGTLAGQAGWTTSLHPSAQSALLVDGQGSSAKMGNQSSLSLGATATLEAWVYPTASGSIGTILNKENEYALAVSADGTVQCAFHNGSGWYYTSTGMKLALSTWAHVAVTYESGSIKCFLNGKLVTTVTAGSGAIEQHGGEFWIGGRQDNSGEFFTGALDEVKVWNTVRSDQDIATSAGVQPARTLDYAYDAIGNVTSVCYQKKVPLERLTHYYSYDADLRLSKVETGPDDPTATVTTPVHTEQARYEYYLHGPLKRMVYNKNLQGVDYTYTAQGWLKSINHQESAKDPGQDGFANTNSTVLPDLFGTSLHYYTAESDDYSSSALPGNYVYMASAGDNSRYNGSLTGAVWHTTALNQQLQGDSYRYDVKGNLIRTEYGHLEYLYNNNISFFRFNGPLHDEQSYRETGISYDPNGNILHLKRTDGASLSTLDGTYQYPTNTNKLAAIQNVNNQNVVKYTYDELGQMTGQVELDPTLTKYLEYDVTGKVTAVFRDAAKKQPIAQYSYNEAGQRSSQQVYDGVTTTTYSTTYFARDASGKEVATYIYSSATGQTTLYEQPIYGAARLGVLRQPRGQEPAQQLYELNDQLGNTRIVFRNPETKRYTLTMEGGQTEKELFPGPDPATYDAVRTSDFGHLSSSSAGLINQPGKNIGPTKTLVMQRGDKLKLSVYAGYPDANVINLRATPVAFLVTTGAQQNLATPANENTKPLLGWQRALGNLSLGIAFPIRGAATGGTPAPLSLPWAGLQYVVTKVSDGSVVGDGSVFIDDQAHGNWQKLALDLEITEPSPVNVEVRMQNYDGTQMVYFDDLQVEHTIGPVVEENHFYAYGMRNEGLSWKRQYLQAYGRGYQGQHTTQDAETGYTAFELRMYDARYGRWLGTDPMGQYFSPYVGMGNDPVNRIDSDGGFDWYTKNGDANALPEWFGGSGPQAGYTHIGASFDGNMDEAGGQWRGWNDGTKSYWIGESVVVDGTKDFWDLKRSGLYAISNGGQHAVALVGELIATASIGEVFEAGSLGIAGLRAASATRAAETVAEGIPAIRATQVGLRNPAVAKQIASDMLEGTYRYSSKEGTIGGFVRRGVYYVGEGHHRMAAAMHVFKITGNAEPVLQLIRFGSWTETTAIPQGARMIPKL